MNEKVKYYYHPQSKYDEFPLYSKGYQKIRIVGVVAERYDQMSNAADKPYFLIADNLGKATH